MFQADRVNLYFWLGQEQGVRHLEILLYFFKFILAADEIFVHTQPIFELNLNESSGILSHSVELTFQVPLISGIKIIIITK